MSRPHVIRAKFDGADNSLGYKHGKRYTLKTETRPSEIFDDNRPIIYVEREDGTGGCEYEHWEKFLDNWDNLEKVESEL